MQTNLTNRKKIILLISFGLILLFLFLILRTSSPAPVIKFSDFTSLPGNAGKTPLGYANDTLFFSNGRYFVSYDSISGKSKSLSITADLPEVTSISVSPSAKHLAFETGADAETIEPFKSLLQANLNEDDQDSQEWWLLDIQTGQISYITTGSPSFIWLASSKYAYASGSEILSKSIGANKISSLYKGAGQIDGLGIAGNNLYFNEQGKGLKSINLQAKQSRNLGLVAATAEFNPVRQDCFYYVVADDTEEAAHELTCSEHHVSLPEAIYSTKFSADGNYFFYYYTARDGKLTGGYVDLNSDKNGTWLIDDNSVSGDDLQIISAASSKQIILRSGANYFSNHIKGISLIDQTSSVTTNNLTIDLLGKSTDVTVSKSGSFTPQDYRLVDQLLTNKGYNPDLLSIRYSVITSDDNRWN